jgi:histidinol dehydrogenase
MSIGPVHNHREREEGVLVYPVYSRRSKGLSIGINLFPDHKVCSFDCPYCEVFPFRTGHEFSLSKMEVDLREAVLRAKEQDIPVRDICFSGNGEPVLSPFFQAALETALRVRDSEVPGAELVLITNGAGLLDEETFSLLCRAALKEHGLHIWLKLDAGTSFWYKAIDRSSVPFELLTEKIRDFVKRAPVTLQTMLCAIDGKVPPPDEARAWESLVTDLALTSLKLRGVQIYGKARPAPEDPLASALPETFLEERAASLRVALASAGKIVPVEVYP